MVDQWRIMNTLGKMSHYLSTHNSICVGVSGGSDSNIIVHMIATYFREYLPKVHFVFQNTGLEYRATLKHLDYMENRYNIHIDKITGESVVSVINREGIPIKSKEFSTWVQDAEKNLPYALNRISRTKEESSFALSDKQKKLAHYLIDNNIPVSAKCCNLSKKKPYHKYLKSISADLTISGERKAEGGIRATRHSSCFETGDKYDKYMPLFFWDDETKQYYKEHEKIVYSDCYEVWGMKRTGCVGCPFNLEIGEDLKKIKKYEPQMYRACIKVFGKSYELMDRFEIRKKPIFDNQLSLLEEE